jgi:hypothetical protein
MSSRGRKTAHLSGFVLAGFEICQLIGLTVANDGQIPARTLDTPRFENHTTGGRRREIPISHRQRISQSLPLGLSREWVFALAILEPFPLHRARA